MPGGMGVCVLTGTQQLADRDRDRGPDDEEGKKERWKATH
jgi:hypothetical protein